MGVGYNFVSVFGNLNINAAEASENRDIAASSNNLALMFGAGAAYKFSNTFSMNILDSYYLTFAPTINTVAPTANELNSSLSNFGFGNVNYISLGMQYLF